MRSTSMIFGCFMGLVSAGGLHAGTGGSDCPKGASVRTVVRAVGGDVVAEYGHQAQGPTVSFFVCYTSGAVQPIANGRVFDLQRLSSTLSTKKEESTWEARYWMAGKGVGAAVASTVVLVTIQRFLKKAPEVFGEQIWTYLKRFAPAFGGFGGMAHEVFQNPTTEEKYSEYLLHLNTMKNQPLELNTTINETVRDLDLFLGAAI